MNNFTKVDSYRKYETNKYKQTAPVFLTYKLWIPFSICYPPSRLGLWKLEVFCRVLYPQRKKNCDNIC